ncbi:hypothetical protein FEE59_17290 [Herbaspirillum sp. RU 5E]|jgi:hypothetical protein|uniref:Uncharacterized protein n=1 Tax=Herbaspirillum aquaticum TaxID=568783 RepID=A0A225SZ41_9BURK|nr:MULTISPECIES: hypothetical protein [Herbaspirillum]MBW9335266.1 hypothetical protein [Herbaspirillum sp. RU 5E]MRT29200.1 hypothetical protein [Herbaspirillum sp. CAH-3]OWY36599.1 hypothetical protein CEJ45_00430 [Herbaspirillum aquaticum]
MSDAASSIEEALVGKTTYTLDVTQAGTALRKIPIETIRDVRSLGIDLLLVLRSGGQILLREGALDALVNPERRLEFSDGVLTLQQIFMQSEQFDFLNQSGSSLGHDHPVADAGGRHWPEWVPASPYPFGG